MNENLNLVEILKDYPEGIKLYSMVHGEVEFAGCNYVPNSPVIIVKLIDERYDSYTSQGLLDRFYAGECVLFPSKNQRDWSKFGAPGHKDKFDPKTLQPFDKVLVRDTCDEKWNCNIFSHMNNESDYPYFCVWTSFKFVIPYNEDTKHLVGTTEEAPEFYRYWED
ncbi:MAG: hypothetical protein ACI30X_07115 [Muribaculaceae bacterium]